MRLGVYGGTFDPPHLGHLVAASQACEALALHRVLWVPSAVHPLKGGQVRTPPELRLEMVRAAIAGDPRFQADDLELRREGPSYTADTLRELRAREPGAELFFITGADILRELHRWREPDEILRLATLVVVSRAGEAVPEEGGVPARGLEITRMDVSSTDVRRRAADGLSIRYLVPDAVRAVIERERLYRGLSR